MRSSTRLALGLLLVVVGSKPAAAAFHEIKVKEVFAGSAAHPNAQYVLLQAYSGDQNLVNGHSVLTFNADRHADRHVHVPGRRRQPR